MFLIEIAGGILIEKYRNGKSILESINNALALTTENVKLFLPSLVLVTIAIGFIEERYAASNTISGIRSGFSSIDSIEFEGRHCEILNGTPILGGEELENNSKSNFSNKISNILLHYL